MFLTTSFISKWLIKTGIEEILMQRRLLDCVFLFLQGNVLIVGCTFFLQLYPFFVSLNEGVTFGFLVRDSKEM